ncbi:DUF1829 domain-containing protein [bacterium]|nr:DUF1829 domain-containing protein [bacterium]
MISEIKKLLDGYYSWLRGRTTLREVNEDWVEITTPFLDRHNDYLQIYAQARNGVILLTDDNYILEDLRNSGCELDSDKRQELLKLTLNGFGVNLDSGALTTRATSNNFAQKKHNLIQAMIAVNDLFYTARPFVRSLFLEEVASWFEQREIRYTERVKFSGKSGYDHVFDFVVPHSRSKPERIIKAINRPNRAAVEALILSWVDTRETRREDSRAYAFLNDSDEKPQRDLTDALENYEVRVVQWSIRDRFATELAA